MRSSSGSSQASSAGAHARRRLRSRGRPGVLARPLALGLAGAALGWLIFTKLLGIGDDDVFDFGGIISAVIGVLILLPSAGFVLRRSGTGRHLDDARVGAIAERHGRTPAQVLIRWCVQRDLIVLPKSTHRERIAANAEVFDFALSDNDVAVLDALDVTGGTAEALERKWW